MERTGYGFAGAGIGGLIAFLVLRRFFDHETFAAVNRMAMFGVILGMAGGGVATLAATNGNHRTAILSVAVTVMAFVFLLIFVSAGYEANGA